MLFLTPLICIIRQGQSRGHGKGSGVEVGNRAGQRSGRGHKDRSGGEVREGRKEGVVAGEVGNVTCKCSQVLGDTGRCALPFGGSCREQRKDRGDAKNG